MSTIGSSLFKGEDGTGLINPSVLNQIAGLAKDLTRVAFDAAVTQERANIINNGTGIWSNGEKISIFGELGTRIWFVGSSAALSHARNVSYQGKTYPLAADANVFGATAGAPASGTGANGDFLVDGAAGLIYGPKASGAWPAGVAPVSATASTPTGLIITGTNQTVASAASPYQWLAATGTLDLQNATTAAIAIKMPEDAPLWAKYTITDAGTADLYPFTVSTTGVFTGGMLSGTAPTASVIGNSRYDSFTFQKVASSPSVWRTT